MEGSEFTADDWRASHQDDRQLRLPFRNGVSTGLSRDP